MLIILETHTKNRRSPKNSFLFVWFGSASRPLTRRCRDHRNGEGGKGAAVAASYVLQPLKFGWPGIRGKPTHQGT